MAQSPTPTSRTFGRVHVELVQGDIVRQPDVDAVVNAANAQLRIGGGVAGAIHRAAGSGLEAEAVPLGPIRPGQAVVTGGHGLANRYVIHVLGPVYGLDTPSDALLSEGYRNALRLAEEKEMSSLAFPAISTGAFGYPVEDAAHVALGAVADVAPTLQHVRLVRFVLFTARDLAVHQEALAQVPGDEPGEAAP